MHRGGTSLLLIDVIGIILLYEFVSRLVRALFGPVVPVTAARHVNSTTFVFTSRWCTAAGRIPALHAWPGFGGKAAICAVLLDPRLVYLRYFEP